MEFQIEEMTDVCAIEVSEVSAADLQEVGEQIEQQQVRIAKSSIYEEPVEAVPVVTVEEWHVISSKDSVNVQAAKQCVNELLSRQNCSHTKYTVRSHCAGDMSAPSLADFCADMFLCAKRSLPRFQYQIFCWAMQNCFDGWHRVPEAVRKNIFENTGKLLIERKIFNSQRGTKPYWFEGLRQNGRPRTQRTSFRLV